MLVYLQNVCHKHSNPSYDFGRLRSSSNLYVFVDLSAFSFSGMLMCNVSFLLCFNQSYAEGWDHGAAVSQYHLASISEVDTQSNN